jgi:hypothetical protein
MHWFARALSLLPAVARSDRSFEGENPPADVIQ